MSFDELPDLLTVSEAAQFLRIGRSLAYDLARRWLATGGREGLPVVQLGRRLLVPKRQLSRFLDALPSPLAAVPEPAPAATPAPSRPRARSHRSSVPATQYSLLDPDQPTST